jgi:glycosyltransferase involved in cell wall biosynthesis
MTDALAHVTVETTEDPLLREAASIQLRRAALWTHSAAAWSNAVARSVGLPVPAPPLVSGVLVTRRPEFLRTALQQIARQTWSRLEVVLGLHGDRFTPDAVARALRDVPQPVTVVEVPAALPYGEALNHAVAASTGTWVTKWDDDDLYGPDHVGDLLLAAAYSGATIVGKGSEYVLLEELGITVRNPGHRSERRVQWVAGGTLTCRRQTLEEVGGWRPVASSVDLALLRQVLDAGGTVYRTHGMGYILRRHRHGHTWEPGLGHFLRGDGLQWRASSPLQDVVLNTSPP